MWIFYIVCSAFLDSLKVLLGKKGTNRLDHTAVAWSQWVFALFLLIPLLIISKPTSPSSSFWSILVLSGVCNTISTMLFWRTVSQSDISLVLPLASSFPILLLITSPILTHEFPSAIGIIGIMTTIIGAYFLNLSKRVKGAWEPLKHIFTDPGLRPILIVMILWSIASNLDKIAVQQSSPLFYITCLHIFVAALLSPILISKKQLPIVIKSAGRLAPIGLASGSSLALQMLALTGAIVPYVLTVKRVNVFFTILWGSIFLHEKQTRERLVGALVMVTGIVLVTLFG